MKKSWGLLPKILTGQKKIESRWYKSKYSPWGKINPEDIVYFKNSGELVSAKATVEKVLQFENLNPEKINEILNTYGKEDGIETQDIPKFFQGFKDKKYCILIFLKDAQKIEPFKINKSGFGAMASWIAIDDVNKLIK